MMKIFFLVCRSRKMKKNSVGFLRSTDRKYVNLSFLHAYLSSGCDVTRVLETKTQLVHHKTLNWVPLVNRLLGVFTGPPNYRHANQKSPLLGFPHKHAHMHMGPLCALKEAHIKRTVKYWGLVRVTVL